MSDDKKEEIHCNFGGQHDYDLRSKRRKLLDGGEEYVGSRRYLSDVSTKRKGFIAFIPFEILQRIFRFVPYNELSETVRMVNRKFKLVAEDVLDSDFRNLQKRLRRLTNYTFKAIELTDDDTQIRCLCVLLNMVDIISFQHSIIMATIRSYVYNTDHYGTKPCCMYAGLILDVYERFFYKFNMNPYYIYGSAVIKESALPGEVENIIQLTKVFCVHFDKVIEESTEYPLLPSAAKIIDILDCGVFIKRTVMSEKATDTTFTAQYSYYLKNAWFLAFNMTPEPNSAVSGPQKQRMMYMRMRRIILAHSEMYMRQYHYEREILLRGGDRNVKRPGILAYTGYGDAENTFFCYGSMNDAAYRHKFNTDENSDDENDHNNFEDARENEDEGGENSVEFSNTTDYLGLHIDVTIRCPVRYAPHSYRKIHKKLTNAAAATANHRKVTCNERFGLNMRFNCPGAEYVRLPTRYEYSRHFSTKS